MFCLAENDISLNRMAALLMLGASSAFMSPFGYQTNLMVFASGGYTIVDFVKFGAPMQIWQMAVSLIVLFLEDQWPLVWIASFLVAGLAISLRKIKESCCMSKKKKALTHVSSREQSMTQLIVTSIGGGGGAQNGSDGRIRA